MHKKTSTISYTRLCFIQARKAFLRQRGIDDIEHLPEEDKKHIFYMIDNLVKAVKLKSIA